MSAILEQAVTITINPVNDEAVIGGVTTGNVTEDSGAGQIASGQLTISDADGASEAAFLPGLIAGTGGFLTLSASGSWSYELDNIIPAVQRLDAGETLIDTVTVRSIDGTTVTIVITINGADEPISNGDAGGLLNGTAGDDLIDAQGGTDVINAGAGNDTVLAGDRSRPGKRRGWQRLDHGRRRAGHHPRRKWRRYFHRNAGRRRRYILWWGWSRYARLFRVYNRC